MAPNRSRFWLPILRLTAFIAAVVVVGNVLLLSAYTPSASEPVSDRSTDFLGRGRRRIEKRIRTFQRFFFGSNEVQISAPPEGSGAIWLAAPELEILLQSEPIADARIAATGLPVTLAAASEVALPEFAPFVLPTLPPPPRLPVELSSIEPWLTPEVISRYYSTKGNVLDDVGDSILQAPESLVDALLQCAGNLLGRSGTVTLRDRSTVTERIFEVQVVRREGRIFSEFVHNWAAQEQRFMARLGDSEVVTPGVQDGTEDVDLRTLEREQGKVLWDALKMTYLSKYRFRGEDRIREDAFYIDQWRGADFVAVPALAAGYVWFRGLEKRVSWGDIWARLTVEPLERWVYGKDDIVAGLSLEWGVKGFPVALIVSAGRTGGRSEMDFIGIGTSVGMVRKALTIQRGD